MKNLLTATLLLFVSICYSQYNYGLEVEQRDAKIEGKLNLGNNTDFNMFIGVDAGISNTSGVGNTSLGYNSGKSNSVNNYNTTIGSEAGRDNKGFINTLIGGLSGQHITNGWGNTLLGYFSGTNLINGVANVMLGRGAGATNVTGNFNVFIGNSAGIFETGSNKLYIESAQGNNPDINNPLIYGEFDNNLLRVNGTLHISETAKLEPQTTAPTCGTNDMGTMYVDIGGVLYFCNGTAWKTVQLN